ncbi:hypothetical protein Cgig2_029304 [Carnegiea gigantea]|uniref:C-22 sterol desaturase n=1 Tax=Carnegiea gigantea TaxID=171969 RepID=A0A9Q1KWM2_9CARY|nr:hypothetical protein Cgig2_029304 [Carnegiea gigantea]
MMDFSTMWEIITWVSPYLATFFIFLVLMDQISYLKKKSTLPGLTFVPPFVGNVFSVIRDPTRFWEHQVEYAKTSPLGVSANYIVGNFTVFIRSSEMSHKVFGNVRPDAFQVIGHLFGKKLFGEHNLIYMYGQEHKDIRRRIAPNFTPKALATYTGIQQVVISKHLMMWDSMCKSSSKSTGSGQHAGHGWGVSGVVAAMDTGHLYAWQTGLPWLAVERLVDALERCVVESEKKMEADEEPKCLIDFWMQDMVREERESGTETGTDKITPPNCGNRNIATYVYRAPAKLVPHVANEDFPLSKSYTIPNVVFPALYESSFQGFTEPDRFDPDRFYSEDRREDLLHKRNFLAFGARAHQCVGQRYALNLLVLFIAMFTSLMDFKRAKTEGCDELNYVPTICPKDDCLVSLSRSGADLPSFGLNVN